ncbi:MAG: hypothetical protein ACRYG6_02765 [Janthinobacterium lividum]
MKVGRCVAVAALLLSGCVRVNVAQHTVASDYVAEPTRILVINSLDAEFARNVVDSFATAIQADLSRCGVASAVFRPDNMQLNAEANFQTAVRDLRPDAVLYMTQAVRGSRDGEVRYGTYILSLRDVAQNRYVWKARVGLGAGSRLFVDRSHAGADFAAAIVKQLSTDRVLKACPAMAATE